MFQIIRPHLIVKLVHAMASSKRWNDFSSDDEEPDKILPPGILSRSIGGVDSEAHQALHNVQACLPYLYWSVRYRSFQKGFNIGSSCPRPKRILLPMEACLQILATVNATKSAHDRQRVFTVPFPFHSELWWLRGARHGLVEGVCSILPTLVQENGL